MGWLFVIWSRWGKAVEDYRSPRPGGVAHGLHNWLAVKRCFDPVLSEKTNDFEIWLFETGFLFGLNRWLWVSGRRDRNRKIDLIPSGYGIFDCPPG